MDSDKRESMFRMQILEHLFKLIYETLGDLRHNRQNGYRRIQAVARMLAKALSRSEFSHDRSRATAEMLQCVELLRDECGRLVDEGSCTDRQRRETEALVGEIVRLAERLREREPA